MKPNNLPLNTCTNTSSSCIVWAGPKIDCLKICTGDSLTHTLYQVATEMCTLMDQLNITNYDLKCLDPQTCKPTDFKGFIQILIDKVCALDTAASGARTAASSDECPNCIVDLAPCFRYPNPANGDTVVQGLLHDYVALIAAKVCGLVTTGNTQGRAIINLNERLTIQEAKTTPIYQLPNLFPVCVANPELSIPLDTLAALTEAKVCEQIAATGTSQQIYNAIADPSIANLKNENALGTTGGKMGSLTGWVGNVENLADSLTNAWLTIMDLRNSIANIKLNCCNTTCSDIGVALAVTMVSSNTLKFYLTGTIPSNFQNCIVGGTLFKIADQSGNYINVEIDVKTTLNDSNGFIVDISGSPLNVADDFTITGTLCLSDTDAGSMCQSILSYYLVNTIDCPVITFTPSENSITYSFDHTGGALTYSVQLFNSSNVLVGSMNFAVTGPTPVSGVFNGLSPNTLYKGRVQMITLENTKTCPYTIVNTLGDSCPAPQSVTATLTIP